MHARTLLSTFATLAAACSLALGALISAPSHADDYVEGEHYDVISPAVRASSEKIEVTEFFWYGCGHCYNFEPQLSQWNIFRKMLSSRARPRSVSPDGDTCQSVLHR